MAIRLPPTLLFIQLENICFTITESITETLNRAPRPIRQAANMAGTGRSEAGRLWGTNAHWGARRKERMASHMSSGRKWCCPLHRGVAPSEDGEDEAQEEEAAAAIAGGGGRR